MSLLAVGGYSKVYRHGPLALKVCDRDKGCQWLFLVREAERHARVPPHENILPILGAFLDERHVVLVTPLQPGGTLRGFLGRRPARPGELAALRLQLSDGLAHLHRAWLLHCDVKPENVLLGRGLESVVISDFGISLSCDEHGVAVCVGQQVGSIGYRAPEVLGASLVTRAVDAWALGCTLLNAAGVSTAPAEGETERDLATRISLWARGREAPLLQIWCCRRATPEAFAARLRGERRRASRGFCV